MAAINDNAALPPTPLKFSDLVAQFSDATAAMYELPNDHDRFVTWEAARMRLLEAYEAAFRGRRLRSV